MTPQTNRARARHHLQGSSQIVINQCHQCPIVDSAMSPNLLPLTLSLVLISVPSWALLNPDLELELDGGPGQERELVDGQERQPQNGPSPSPPSPNITIATCPPSQIRLPAIRTVISGHRIINPSIPLNISSPPPKTDPTTNHDNRVIVPRPSEVWRRVILLQ